MNASSNRDHGDRKTVPGSVVFISLLLLLYGFLALVGCVFMLGDKTLSYYAVRAVIFASTAILVLVNHKWALHFAFLSAAFLTIDGALQYSLLQANFRFSIPASAQLVHFLINAALIWTAYLWYRKWRTKADEHV